MEGAALLKMDEAKVRVVTAAVELSLDSDAKTCTIKIGGNSAQTCAEESPATTGGRRLSGGFGMG